jgi:hypothetical protein
MSHLPVTRSTNFAPCRHDRHPFGRQLVYFDPACISLMRIECKRERSEY